MGSLSPFLWGSCIPYNMPVYPGALSFADYSLEVAHIRCFGACKG